MTKRKMMALAILLCIAITVPLMAAAQQAPPAGGQAGRGGGGGGGQRGGGAPPTNFQILPKDWTRQQIVQVMQQFTMGLGVA